MSRPVKGETRPAQVGFGAGGGRWRSRLARRPLLPSARCTLVHHPIRTIRQLVRGFFSVTPRKEPPGEKAGGGDSAARSWKPGTAGRVTLPVLTSRGEVAVRAWERHERVGAGRKGLQNARTGGEKRLGSPVGM